MNTKQQPKKAVLFHFTRKQSLPFWRRLSTHINLYNLLFSFLFVFMAVIIAFSASRQVILDDTYNLLSSNNLNKINHFREWIRGNEESLESFASRPQVREYTAELIDCLEQGLDCREIENRLLEKHLRPGVAIDADFDEFFIIRASDGKIISGTESSNIGKFREHLISFKHGLVENYTETSAFHFTTGEAVMHTATPLYAPNGEVVAVLTAHLNLEKMYAIIQRNNQRSGSEDSYLVNAFNYFITEPHYGDDFALRRSVYSDGVQDCLAGESDVAEYTDYRGVTVIGAYEWLPDFQICMVSEKDKVVVFAPIVAKRNRFILVGSILFAISITFGYLLSRRITDPLLELERSAKKVGEGDLSARVKISSKNELGLFADTFNQMASNLEQLHARNNELIAQLQDFNKELEARVESRTRDLKRSQLAAEKNMKELQRETLFRRQAQEELTAIARDLQRSNEDLQQFAYVASHDLQEPLRMVASYLQLLEHRYQDKLDADAREFINYAVDGATRMKTLINDLLDFSRVGTRGAPFEEIDLNMVLGKVRANLQLAIEETHAVIVSDELPLVLADPTQMVLLFQNLVGNAIKFHGKKEPRVHITSNETAEEWIISVSDNGIGIDPQYFERIFIIFQRLHTRTEYPGTGIGLAISRRILERHNGRIWVESKAGEGTTFHCALPKVQKEQKPESKLEREGETT